MLARVQGATVDGHDQHRGGGGRGKRRAGRSRSVLLHRVPVLRSRRKRRRRETPAHRQDLIATVGDFRRERTAARFLFERRGCLKRETKHIAIRKRWRIATYTSIGAVTVAMSERRRKPHDIRNGRERSRTEECSWPHSRHIYNELCQNDTQIEQTI